MNNMSPLAAGKLQLQERNAWGNHVVSFIISVNESMRSHIMA